MLAGELPSWVWLREGAPVSLSLVEVTEVRGLLFIRVF